jgi:hypothetical protein
MKTHLAPTGGNHIGETSSNSAFWSLLDGYLVATSSGSNFAVPDQVLSRLLAAGHDIGTSMAKRIVRHYVSVNDALNNQDYVPDLNSVGAWCRGYLAGFVDDMLAWAPMLAAQPELMKVIQSGAKGRPIAGDQAALADVARRIHEFWVERRRSGAGSNHMLAQLAAMLPTRGAWPEHCH